MARPRLTPTVLLIAASIGTVVVLATAAACSTPTAPVPPPPVGDTGPRPGSGGPSAATTASSSVTAPAAAGIGGPDVAGSALGAAPTGSGWESTVLDAVPDPPRLLALPTDFVSPQSVAAAYLRAWCYAPADKPANTNITDTAPWMTAAGWADDAARSVDEPTWARTRSAGVSTVCGPATASVSPQAPTAPDAAWVGVTDRPRSGPAR